MTDDKINAVRELLATGTSVKDAAAAVGVSYTDGFQGLQVDSGSCPSIRVVSAYTSVLKVM